MNFDIGFTMDLADPENLRKSLKSLFHDVSVTTNTDGSVTSRLPYLFNINIKNPAKLQLWKQRLGLGRSTWILEPIIAEGKNEQESLMKLFAKIAFNFDGGFSLYRPKKGQAEDVLKDNGKYNVIRANDRLHDHDSPLLIDFYEISVPFPGMIIREDFDEIHVHLITPEILAAS
ncbi:MAG: hypothetical protein DYH13_02685 [Alphaproteobacteria bacterium PRO2]|nr:hypothetical protein [Alphaproteobacteria bacterium PRO2]